MLVLAVGEVILTGFRGPAAYAYWMALAPIYGFACIGRAGGNADKTGGPCGWWERRPCTGSPSLGAMC